GIGRAFSRFMAARGASVVVVGRTFRDSEVPGIQFVKADLSLMREAQRVGQSLPAEALDLIIFTTGILPGPKRDRGDVLRSIPPTRLLQRRFADIRKDACGD